MVDAILWDMDGTLVDSEPLWEIATYAMGERLGRKLTPEVREKTIGGSFHNTFTICAQHAGFNPTPEREALEYQRTVDTMNELFATGLPFNPGVKRLLKELHAAGIPMLIVTNTVRDVAEGCFRAIGEHLFVDTLAGDDVAHGKPAPDLYLEAARRVGVNPERCLVFEDSATGMQAARTAGCRVIGLPAHADVPIPDGVKLLADIHGENSFATVTVEDIERFYASF
ncbi:HAD family hydrolase [Corynebacterium aquilae]|uniref:Phosphatase n=1 Tax=Corynebacterium aquilae DSM 44791 TaxID=1431546 RepID=A0A1L7CFZ1_9CORY|nr:HAD family phosphatase [Corynebacterium aquilae]APT84759.1 hypothetical protein CAQU_06390 [Corynebacterium aquilae DSM 44791]